MINLPDDLTDFACVLADIARENITPLFRSNISIDTKSDKSPVTLADREAEGAMRRLINRQYPNHGIIGEEYGDENISSDFVWVLDPIDGTRAFIAGKPTFGTLISLLYRNQPVIGIIDQPILKERWVGLAKIGTTLNGAPINTRSCPALSDAILNTTSPDIFDQSSLKTFNKLSNQCKSTLYGGDCYGYGLVACGLIDLVVESDLKPYDFCALIPVVEAAGGRMVDWSGDELSIQSSGKIIAAGDPGLSDVVSDILSSNS